MRKNRPKLDTNKNENDDSDKEEQQQQQPGFSSNRNTLNSMSHLISTNTFVFNRDYLMPHIANNQFKRRQISLRNGFIAPADAKTTLGTSAPNSSINSELSFGIRRSSINSISSLSDVLLLF